MGHRCCSKQKVKRGLWSPEEDEKLSKYITTHGHGSWSCIPKLAGLQRCGKSCRLRWINYLRPDLKRGSFTAQEEQIIIDVHRILGNKWAQIAKHLPGRTDNEVKNFWNSCIKKRLISQGLDPNTHNLISSSHHRGSYKVACNVSQTHHQQPISVFTVNSKNITEANSMEIMKTPFITIPNAQPPLMVQNMSIPITTEDQNTNVVWTVNGHQSSTDFTSTFPYGSSLESISTPNISSSSFSSVYPSGFGISNHENSVWGATTLEPFEAPRLEVVEQPQSRQEEQQEHEKEKISEMGNNQILEAKGYNQDMDVSFDSSNFDLGFMESTLMSGLVYHDLTSMDDLAWNNY